MSKAYLIAFNDAFGTQDQVKTWLDSIPEVTHWRFDIPHSIYFVANIGPEAIGRKLLALAGHEKGLFIITEIPRDAWGYLTPESWYLIQNLRYKPK
jgi:hypothetical protein